MSAVAIVGAGPVGLSAALALARLGVRSVVLEARAGPSGVGSRSICTQGSVLAIFERLGCGEPIVSGGVSWTLGRTYFRDVELFRTHLPAATGEDALPPFVNLGQSDVEAVLLAAVEASPLAEVRMSRTVTGLCQDARGVTLSVQEPGGATEVRAPYVVGCDGPRSRVRTLLGVGLPGTTFADRFLIADIRADLALPGERRFFFDPPFNPGRQVLIHPQPDNVWRIDWQVPPGTDEREERRSGRLDERIRAVIGDADYELVWLSSYRFHQRVAERFRVGRALLAGDAAHLMAPFGARGLNSGVADVDNLSWKLSLVLAGASGDALLDTYDDERREAALANVRVVGDTMRFMVPPTRAGWWLRDALLRGSLHVPALRRFVDSGRLYQPHTYRRSPIVVRDTAATLARLGARPPWGGGPEPGALAPDVPCEVAGRPDLRRLRHLVGEGFLLLALPRDAAAAARVADAAATVDSAARVADAAETVDAALAPSVAVVAPPGRHGPPATGPGVLLVSDATGALRRAYAPHGDRLYLIRPDGHVAARGRCRDAARLGEWLATATARWPRRH